MANTSSPDYSRTIENISGPNCRGNWESNRGDTIANKSSPDYRGNRGDTIANKSSPDYRGNRGKEDISTEGRNFLVALNDKFIFLYQRA